MKLPVATRREQLVVAAVAVMTVEGVEAASSRRIARQAGVSVGVVNYCFGTKANLYRAVITSVIEELGDSVIAPISLGDDLRASLSKSVEALWSTVEVAPERHLLTFELTTHSLRQPALSELAVWIYDTYNTAAAVFFAEVAVNCGIRWTMPIQTLAQMMIALNEGVTLAWLANHDGAQARSILAAFVDMLVTVAVPGDDVLVSGQDLTSHRRT
ncbi:TetR/AcrR family transcriptional regulator [Mycobacterium sp. BMJ-28]